MELKGNPEGARSLDGASNLYLIRRRLGQVEDLLLKRLGIREDKAWWKT